MPVTGRPGNPISMDCAKFFQGISSGRFPSGKLGLRVVWVGAEVFPRRNVRVGGRMVSVLSHGARAKGVEQRVLDKLGHEHSRLTALGPARTLEAEAPAVMRDVRPTHYPELPTQERS